MSSLPDTISKLIAPLQRRVRLMVARAVVELVDDSKKMQSLQISIRADEERADVERFQQYGITSVPKAGAEALVLMVGGSTDHPVVIAVDDRRYRPKGLQEGEVALYTLADAVRVLCKADGKIELGTSPTQYAALANLVKAELDKIQTTLLSGTVSAAPGPVTFSSPYTASEVAASEVKIK